MVFTIKTEAGKGRSHKIYGGNIANVIRIIYDIFQNKKRGMEMGLFFDLGDLVDIGLQIARSVEARDELLASQARAEAARKEAEQQRHRAAAEAKALENRQLAEKIASESVAVSCQSCGARLACRKNSISFCAYCGSAIRVTAEGKTSVLSPEARKAVIDRARAEHEKNNQ